MNRQQIALKMVVRELGIHPKLRGDFQRTIFLIQNFGIPLGYKFHWQASGPYSRDLQSDASLEGIPDSTWNFTSEQMDRLEQLKKFFGKVIVEPYGSAKLEILSDVLFVIKTGQARAESDSDVAAKLIHAGEKFHLRSLCLRPMGF